MTSRNYVIEARNLTKAYGKTQVLNGIDLQVERGAMVALLGPNGAGKTTIIRILSTLLGFDGGTVLFLDEPTTGLDPRSRLGMWEIITNLLAGGTTILLTTQYLEEADQLADRIVVIDGGKVIAEGTPSALKSRDGNDRLELTFHDDVSVGRAVAELGEVVIDSNAKERSATVVITDPSSDVRRALDILAKAGIVVQSLAVHKPTLDDVFLSLTGKQKPMELAEVK